MCLDSGYGSLLGNVIHQKDDISQFDLLLDVRLSVCVDKFGEYVFGVDASLWGETDLVEFFYLLSLAVVHHGRYQ